MKHYFQELALSFYGSDGGNLDSEIWFCGLEWGGSLAFNADTEEEMIAPTAEEGGYLVTTPKINDYRKNISWSLGFEGAVTNGVNQKICWFLNYYYNLEPTDHYSYEQFVSAHEICFNLPTGKGFKMNLFPLKATSHNREWCEKRSRLTGFNNRASYEVWCMIHRGAYYQALLKLHNPKVILGFGKTHAGKYYRFWGVELVDKSTQTLGDITIEYCQIPGTDTYLMITPFFGGVYGINTGEKMQDLTELVHRILKTRMPFKRDV